MPIKTLDQYSTGTSWEDSCNLLKFRADEIYNLRFLIGFFPVAYHWVPFIKKSTKKVKMFPQMCLGYDLQNSRWDSSMSCPACELDIQAYENGVISAINIEKLYEGEEDSSKAIILTKWGPRELRTLKGLSRLNGEKDVCNAKYGRIIQAIFNPDAPQGNNKYQFNMGEKLKIKVEGDRIKVKIPEDADSRHAGKSFVYDLPNIDDLIIAPSYEDVSSKFNSMQVVEAIAKYNKSKQEQQPEKDNMSKTFKSKLKEEEEDDSDEITVEDLEEEERKAWKKNKKNKLEERKEGKKKKKKDKKNKFSLDDQDE